MRASLGIQRVLIRTVSPYCAIIGTATLLDVIIYKTASFILDHC